MQPTTLTFPVPAHEGQAALNRAVAVLQTGGYTVRSTSESEAIGVKRVIPGWAIFLAVVFGLFCLVGLLFLLIKEDREVRASIIVSPDGEAIAVSGSMNSSTVARLRAELEGAYPSPAPVPEMPADPPVDAAPVARAVVPPTVAEPLPVAPAATEAGTVTPPPGAPRSPGRRRSWPTWSTTLPLLPRSLPCRAGWTTWRPTRSPVRDGDRRRRSRRVSASTTARS